MRKITFGRSVLQVEGLEIKYDIVPVSSSLALIMKVIPVKNFISRNTLILSVMLLTTPHLAFADDQNDGGLVQRVGLWRGGIKKV